MISIGYTVEASGGSKTQIIYFSHGLVMAHSDNDNNSVVSIYTVAKHYQQNVQQRNKAFGL